MALTIDRLDSWEPSVVTRRCWYMEVHFGAGLKSAHSGSGRAVGYGSPSQHAGPFRSAP
jgi:hypothetical protein